MSLVGSWNCNDGIGNAVGGSPSAGSIDPAAPAGTISNATDNGSGAVRITCVGHGLSTGQTVRIDNVGGTTEANGTWFVTIYDPDNFDLDGSAFANAYTSGGDFIVPWSWSVEDPPIGGTAGSLFLTSQSHVDLPSIGTFGKTTSFTVAAWVRRSSTATGRSAALSLSNASGDFTCCLGTPSGDPTKFGIDVGNSYNFSEGTAASSAYTLNTWYHIAAVCKSTSELDFYQDGVYQSTLTYSGATLSAADNSNGWSIGSEQDLTAPDDYAYAWDGEVAFAKVYDHELSVAEIEALAGVSSSPPPVVSLTASTTSITENGGEAALIATLDQTASASVVVTLSASGAASSTSDYTLSTNTITIASGQTSASISATAIPDVVYEGNEQFTASITSVTGGGASASSTASTSAVTIVDDETQPSVTISASPTSIAENGGVSVVTATLSNASVENVTVNFAFSGTATNNTDYSRSGTSVTINAGSTSGSISITAINDATYDGNETVIVDVSSVTNGTENGTQSVTITIVDDEPQPTFNISQATTTIAENGGTAILYGVLSHASYQQIQAGITFGGQATLNTDYSRSPGIIITVPAGDTSGSISITALQDLLDEDNETITVSFSSVTNAIVGATTSLSFTITDDDPNPTASISASTSSIVENGGTGAFVVTLSGPSGISGSVLVGFVLGTATLNVDFTASATTIPFPPGTTSGSVSVTSISDVLFESNETIVASIDGSNIGIGSPFSASITIVNEYLPPFVSVSAVSASLPESGSSTAIVATMDHTHSANVTVVLGFGGTASTSSDYSYSTNTIVILSGASTGSVSITSLQDSVSEGPETIVVSLASVTNGTAASAASATTVSIVDDDSRGSGASGLSGLSGLSGVC